MEQRDDTKQRKANARAVATACAEKATVAEEEEEKGDNADDLTPGSDREVCREVR